MTSAYPLAFHPKKLSLIAKWSSSSLAHSSTAFSFASAPSIGTERGSVTSYSIRVDWQSIHAAMPLIHPSGDSLSTDWNRMGLACGAGPSAWQVATAPRKDAKKLHK